MKNKLITAQKTSAAIVALWGPGTAEQRWQSKVNSIIQFVARLGWATVEMVNFHLGQSKRDWVAKMSREKWLISKIAIIDDRPATILVLTHKAHRVVKKIYPYIGRRIEKEASRQSRHDFVASHVALWLLRTRHDLKMEKNRLEVWADRVMRGFLFNEETRPDISIMRDGDVLINIEVERSRKSSAQERYQFFKKLEYFQCNEVETFVIFESRSLASLFVEEMQRAKHFGLTPWIKSRETKTWLELKNHDREIFDPKIILGIWDNKEKTVSEVFYSDPYF